MRGNRSEQVLLVCIVLIIIAMMLYFGLRLKGYRPANNVQWVDGGPGVAFDPFAVAYTEEVDFSALKARNEEARRLGR